jgi:lipopolysaccharide export system permease protein
MKLLDRYIALELTAPFFFGVGAFTSIVVASQLFFKLTGYVAKGAPLFDIVALFVLRLVPMIVVSFPMAMLLATLLTFGRLSGDSELIAMLSSGIPFLRTAMPAFVAGALVSAGGLGLNELVAPSAGRAAASIERQIVEVLRASGADVSAPTPNRAFVVQDTGPDGQLDRLIVAEKIDLATNTMSDVTVVAYGPAPGGGRQVNLLLEAKRGVWVKGSRWIFYDGRTQVVNPSSNQTGGGAGKERYTLAGPFQSFELTIHKTPRQVIAQQRDADEMNYVELREYITNLRDQGASRKAVRELEVDLHSKLSIPFASTVFALVGAPLGLRRLRGGASVGLGLSVLIILAYYILWHGLHVLGEGGQISPFLASWLPNILGLAAGLVLILRAPT